ncbi:hypothetical protein AAG565_05300 [Fontimonas sp. SYSU GA230001]|uniref:hypothetical protein n=1 Tax=Fontimonas sp. SYSU GA230001 TaxID=3142450 RepID=UPI0032B34F8E
MNEALLYYWHWFIAAMVVFTLLGYFGLMMGHGQERRNSGPLRKPAVPKERRQ